VNLRRGVEVLTVDCAPLRTPSHRDRSDEGHPGVPQRAPIRLTVLS
jgi:hypothetical protein